MQPHQVKTVRAYAWQRQAFNDRSPVMLLTGGAGGGKSFCAAYKVYTYLRHYPGAFGVMLRKTRESMVNSTVLFYEHEVAAMDPGVEHVASKRRFEFNNGSILAYGGMKDEAQREQIRSIGQFGGVDIAWLEEAHRFSESDFNEILARMRGRAADWRQVILTTNPDADTHWINLRLILGEQAKTIRSFAPDNLDNPEDYIATLDSLTGIQHDRLVKGLWKRSEGSVYDMFDRQLHVVDPFPIPNHWRRYRSIDFGYVNPFVCQWWARSPDDKLYLYREIYRTKSLVADLAKEINLLSQDEQFEWTVCDHDAEDRAQLTASGIPNVSARKDIKMGLQVVKNRLRKSPKTGQPGIFFFTDALLDPDLDLIKRHLPSRTEDEFSGYTWASGPDRRPIPEVPIDKDNHGMDSMRYLVMQLDFGRYGAQVILPRHIYQQQELEPSG